MAAHRRQSCLWALALAGLVAPLGAQAQTPHWAVPLRAQIARVSAVDWRIATVAAPRCNAIAAGTGLALDSLAAYPAAERAAIADALGMAEGVVVVHVAADSPAAKAGLMAGDRLISLGGTAFAASGDPSLIADEAAETLARLPVGTAATILYERNGAQETAQIVPVARCAARSIMVVDDTVDAYGDSRNLAVTTALVDFVRNEDELALLAGHELAHIILAPAQKEAGIRGPRKEREADRLGAQIAACAGYDIALASHFWSRFDSTRVFGFLPTLTHPRSKTRQRDVAAMAGTVDCAPFSPAR